MTDDIALDERNALGEAIAKVLDKFEGPALLIAHPEDATQAWAYGWFGYPREGLWFWVF